MADDIERYLAGKPVKAQPDSRGYRLRKFVQRNALAVAAGSAIVAALAIGLGAALWQANVAGDQARRATLIKDFVLAIIQQADPVASGQTRAADVALLTTAEARVDRELEREPELALQMRRAIGAAYRNRGEFDRASRVLRKGIEQARASLPPDNLELLGAMVQIADRWVVDSAQVKTDIETAVTRLRGLGPDAQLLLADALLARHKVMNWHVSWRDAVASEREAYGAARATGDQGRALDVAIESATWHLTNEIEPRMALTMLTEALEAPTQGRPVDATDPRRIIAMAWQGAALCHAGQEAEGLRRTEEALDAARKFHGADSNAAEQVHGALGNLLELCTRELKRALAPTRAAYDLAVKRESPDAENRTWRQISLMRLLIMLNLLDEADEVLRESPLDVLRPGARTAPAVVGLMWESHVRGFLGETGKALELAEQAARLMEQQNMLALAEQVYAALSRALQRSGNYERAEEAALAAIKHEDLWSTGDAEAAGHQPRSPVPDAPRARQLPGRARNRRQVAGVAVGERHIRSGTQVQRRLSAGPGAGGPWAIRRGSRFSREGLRNESWPPGRVALWSGTRGDWRGGTWPRPDSRRDAQIGRLEGPSITFDGPGGTTGREVAVSRIDRVGDRSSTGSDSRAR